jgi:DNA-binding NarL/FixJ family response regulator
MADIQAQQNSISVLVVDDQRLMREGLASLLSIQEGIEVVGTAVNGQDALEQAQQLSPDVILMDVRMPVLDGVAATIQIRQQLPACQILMLTTFDDDEYVINALRAGATGYLLKDIPANDLAKAVQAAHKGIYQLDPAIASKVVASLSNPPQPTSIAQEERSASESSILANDNRSDYGVHNAGITAREIEVLRLIAVGATNKEIARRLIISEGTVKNHISNILSRLGLRDRTQAAIYARENGLL